MNRDPNDRVEQVCEFSAFDRDRHWNSDLKFPTVRLGLHFVTLQRHSG